MRVRASCALQGEIIDPKGHPARIDAATLQLGIRVTVRLHHPPLSQRRHCASARLAWQVGRTTAAATASTAPTTADFQAVRASLAALQRLRVLRHSPAGGIRSCTVGLTCLMRFAAMEVKVPPCRSGSLQLNNPSAV